MNDAFVTAQRAARQGRCSGRGDGKPGSAVQKARPGVWAGAKSRVESRKPGHVPTVFTNTPIALVPADVLVSGLCCTNWPRRRGLGVHACAGVRG